MTVRIEKPALNLREEINRLDKPTGIAGEAMLRAETPQEQFDLIGAGRRNLIINGGMQVSQRGIYTSATTVTNGSIYIDRYVSYAGNVGGTVQDMGGSIKHTATSSTVGYLGLEQKIEDYSRLGGETITVSAEVKSNHSSAQIMIYDSAYRNGVRHSGSGDWEKLTHTFTVDTSLSRLWVQVWIADSASSLNANITSGDYIEVRNFQVERGKVATPFEHRSYVEELALCQRYFYAFQSPNDPLGENGFMGTAYSTDNLYCPIFLPVQMRDVPGIISGGQWAIRRGNNFAFTGAFSQQRGGRNTMIIAQGIPSGSGITVTDAVWIEPFDNTAYLYFQAEL